MNTRTILFSLPLALLPLASTAQETAPAVEEKVTELQELVVKGDNVWIEGNKVVFKPLKSAKNLATDAASLIDNMHTGLLKSKDGSITTALGDPVTIFINGVKADNIDLSTFWPKNALRVEYMESSDDPRFQGATNIVNFIMKEYVTGGLTKLNGYQSFPNSGEYSASSKLVYKKMTYNALLSGKYSRDHRSRSEETQHYDDVWYDGVHYDRIEREERSHNVNRNNDLYAGFNARYRTDKLLILHSAHLQWNENPESGSYGFTQYSPSIIDTDWMRSALHSRSLSPSVTGYYSFDFSQTWQMTTDWTMNHSHNNIFSSYAENDVAPIDNRAIENLYSYGTNINLFWRVRNNFNLIAYFTENRYVSTIDYTGSADSRQWQQSGTTRLKLRGWWRPTSRIVFDITPQVTLSDWNINHTTKQTEWLPGVNGSINWTLSSTTRLGAKGYYEQHSPSASVRSDLILRQSELKWLEGNPNIGSRKYWVVGTNVYCNPISWFNTYASVTYNSRSGESIIEYRSGGPVYDGVIGQYRNVGTGHDFGLYWEGNASLLNNNLYIGDEVEYSYAWYDYAGSRKVGSWRNCFKVSYTLGNCRLIATWYTPTKTLSNGGTTVRKGPHSIYVSFNYGNGNFNFSIQGADLLNKYNKYDVYYNAGAFGYNGRSFSTGRSLNLSVTYTFDYGKKIDPNISIHQENTNSSAILGSDK